MRQCETLDCSRDETGNLDRREAALNGDVHQILQPGYTPGASLALSDMLRHKKYVLSGCTVSLCTQVTFQKHRTAVIDAFKVQSDIIRSSDCPHGIHVTWRSHADLTYAPLQCSRHPRRKMLRAAAFIAAFIASVILFPAVGRAANTDGQRADAFIGYKEEESGGKAGACTDTNKCVSIPCARLAAGLCHCSGSSMRYKYIGLA